MNWIRTQAGQYASVDGRWKIEGVRPACGTGRFDEWVVWDEKNQRFPFGTPTCPGDNWLDPWICLPTLKDAKANVLELIKGELLDEDYTRYLDHQRHAF